MSREEMDQLAGIAATLFWSPATPMSTTRASDGDICGRMLEAPGVPRQGSSSQPDWNTQRRLSCVWANRTLFFGVTAGNMDSMINCYAADRNYVMTMPIRAGNVRGQTSGPRHRSTPSAVKAWKRCR